MSKYSPEWRAAVVQNYLTRTAVSYHIADKYSIDSNTVRRWAQGYSRYRIAAFSSQRGNSTYSAEFKKMCVESYLQGGYDSRLE